MNDTVKLIIEIPTDVYRKVQAHKSCIITTKQDDQEIVIGVRKGIPLDSDSERAEVQAYFAGEAYGWEQGRKALIDDVKAEIEQNAYPIVHGVNNCEKGMTLYGILQVLDNIGKESEDKEC